MKNLSFVLATCLLAPGLSFAQVRVDLRANQTPLVDQGSRNTCITFSATGALEAAYRRAGYGTLDLSEEFMNYMGKTFWLHPNWDNPAAPAPMLGTTSADRTENQLGYTGGGGGFGYLLASQGGLAIPTEADMPYRATISAYSGIGGRAWNDPYWASQTNTNTINLDERNLPFSALTAPRYYRATAVRALTNARSTAEVETALRMGREVVWDFLVAGTRTGLWRVSGSSAGAGAHSMLIVGYDRSSTDTSQHYFIVKNSWGATHFSTFPGDGGYTRISYDYLRTYGVSGGYIERVAPPAPWQELAFVGRWNLRFDGHRGTLDIYHLPGQASAVFAADGVPYADRRLGTFRDTAGNVFRVNGYVSGNQITFWFKPADANMRWDRLRDEAPVDRLFSYTLLPGNRELAGWHQDNPGDIPNPAFGGYARKDGPFVVSFNNSQPWAPEQFLGRWVLRHEAGEGSLVCRARADHLVHWSRRAIYAGLACEYTALPGTATFAFTAEVPRTDPGRILLDLPETATTRLFLEGRMLSHQRGVAAGEGFYMRRTGNP